MRGTTGLLTLIVAAACATQPGVQLTAKPAPTGCRTVDSLSGVWLAAVFVDGTRVGDHLPARRDQVEPETFDLTGPEPPGLASIRPEDLDLLQFSRGAEAERTLALCPGYLAILVTTKPRRQGYNR